MVKKKERQYSAKDITYFSSDVEKVQVKPSMYMGSLDQHGLLAILREVVDNSIDEARAGRNDFVSVEVTKDGHYIVSDNGAGIPVEKHPEAKIPTIVHIFTALQSSGKIKSSAYENAGGTHGCGVTVTNALSETLECWTYRKSSSRNYSTKPGWWYVKFENGKVKVKPKKISKKPFTQKKGTVIKFKPQLSYFTAKKASTRAIAELLKRSSYLNSGLTLQMTAKGKTKVWKAKEGLKDYLKDRASEFKVDIKKSLVVTSESGHVELALAFTDNDGCAIKYSTNAISNIDGGVHADNMQKALHNVLKKYAPKMQFTKDDLLDGLIGLLNFNINDAQFSNQSKDKLVDTRAKEIVLEECTRAFIEFFRSNKKFALDWCKRASELRKAQALFQKNKAVAKKVKKANETLSAKLADVNGTAKPEDCELYLVEGDSAGGSGKLARCKSTQALFPLKGKPLNVMEASPDRILANNEIPTLLSAVGFDFNSDEPTKKIKYGKIIILADADVDGKHIETLLLAFFYKFAPNYFKERRIYTIDTPEFLGKTSSKTYFGNTKSEVYKQAGTKNINVQHFKGLGQMNPDDLDLVAFDKSTRKLVRIKEPSKEQRKKFESLMGKNSAYRKQLMGIAE